LIMAPLLILKQCYSDYHLAMLSINFYSYKFEERKILLIQKARVKCGNYTCTLHPCFLL
jgi:hypothetical protein